MLVLLNFNQSDKITETFFYISINARNSVNEEW